MKIFKNFWLSIIPLALFGFVLFGHKAYAAPINITANDLKNVQYDIVAFDNGNPATIQADIAGTIVYFVDPYTPDDIIGFTAHPGDNYICEMYGINFTGGPNKKTDKTGTFSGKLKLAFSNDTTVNCNESNPDKTISDVDITVNYDLSKATGDAGDLGTTTGTGEEEKVQPDENACLNNSGGFSFAWAVCPILDAASGLSTTLVNAFEDQLAFSVDQLGSSSDVNTGAGKMHQAWALFRDLTSALLVIVLLIMVLSQAASFGPFDAYTVRKLLPRLIAAVILMQISWDLFAWIVNVVNDIGRGIADLMFWPFGGAKNMDLWHLLSNAHLSNGLLISLNWGALLVVGVLGYAYLFTMLGFAFVAIIGLFFAFLTLVFRKILIIILLILSPLALLAWILPGTESYWKMWRENFMKALFMFPIAVAIIAAGRIFAYVVGTQNNGQFLNLIFIMVGFFGPLFILPKTFKWGGQAMQLAGNSMMKASGKMSERPKKFMDKRQEGWSAERRRQSEERYSRGQGFNWRRPWHRPIDLVRSGQVDPTLWGRRREQAMTAYAAAGAESEEKDVKAADARAQLLFDQVTDHDELARAMAAGDENYVYTTHDGQQHRLGRLSMAERRAGLNAVAKFGGDTNFRFLDRTVDALNTGRPEERAMAKKFLDGNAQTLIPKMKHLYYGANREGAINSSLGSLSEKSFLTMEGAEMEAILESLSQRAAAGDAAALDQINRVLTFYQSAIDNDTIRPNIGAGVNRAMEALVTGGNIADINNRRTAAGMDPIDRTVAANPAVAPAVAAIAGRIDINGRVT